MRIHAKQSVLLVVDVQARLLPAIHQGQAVLDNVCWLMGVARAVGVPVLATEQYPRGLGGTVPAVRAQLDADRIVEKEHFSAVSEGRLWQAPGGDRHRWVVTGTESHVCVQQTVLDLLAAGRRVFVVEEAVGSRRERDKQLALERMRQHGADIVSREMVAFEWLEKANTATFRAVLKEFIR
ncbi:MAG: isochorismatase family protein [Azovibrio sp.]|nr:isochorismatase family protein [Azovibrio sp.]